MPQVMPMLKVRQARPEMRDGKLVQPFAVEVFRGEVSANDRYGLMCAALDSDIVSAEGSGATAIEELRRVEAGEVESIDSDGNAWVIHLTRSTVWFEGLYGQGTGGEVSFAQYKLAVQTYVRYLADPEHKPIQVPFPED